MELGHLPAPAPSGLAELEQRKRRTESLLSKPHLLNRGEAAELRVELSEVCLAILAFHHANGRGRPHRPAA